MFLSRQNKAERSMKWAKIVGRKGNPMGLHLFFAALAVGRRSSPGHFFEGEIEGVFGAKPNLVSYFNGIQFLFAGVEQQFLRCFDPVLVDEVSKTFARLFVDGL